MYIIYIYIQYISYTNIHTNAYIYIRDSQMDVSVGGKKKSAHGTLDRRIETERAVSAQSRITDATVPRL